MIITTNEDFVTYMTKIKQSKYIAVDTEFIRMKNYYPELSLIQFATHDICFAIDLTVKTLDYHLLLDILTDKDILKIFHCANQDVEAFYYRFNIIIHPIYDTQIAHYFLSGQNLGYDKMVLQYINKKICKVVQFSNWLKRPLSRRQILYALDDVIHLIQVYLLINEECKAINDWVAEDSNCYSKQQYQFNPTNQVKKLLQYLTKKQDYTRCWNLVKWRDTIARNNNVTKNTVMSDNKILALAKNENNYQQFYNKNNMPDITETESVQLEQLVGKNIRRRDIDTEKIESLQLLLQKLSTQYNISPQIIASKSDLKKFINGDKTKLSSGWRYNIFNDLASSSSNK